MRRDLTDLMRDVVDHQRMVDAIPSLTEWSRKVPDLSGCGNCGARVLIDVESGRARCAGGCGWTGVVLRRLP